MKKVKHCKVNGGFKDCRICECADWADSVKALGGLCANCYEAQKQAREEALTEAIAVLERELAQYRDIVRRTRADAPSEELGKDDLEDIAYRNEAKIQAIKEALEKLNNLEKE